MKTFLNLLAQFLILLIKGYQLTLSRILPPACRHIPSCSQYAIEAIKIHGPFRGVLLAARRVGTCHPWGRHGYDPVPKEGPSHVHKSL